MTRLDNEHQPGEVVRRAWRQWRVAGDPIVSYADEPCPARHGARGHCLVVVKPRAGGSLLSRATRAASVTIGISGSPVGAGPRVRVFTPAHYWPELDPWPRQRRGENRPWLDASARERLAAWADDASKPDRVLVPDGSIAFAWQEWSRAIHQLLESNVTID